MVALLIICFLAGGILGLRFPVLILVPALFLFAASALGIGVVSVGAFSGLAIDAAGAFALLQVGYLAGGFLRACLPMRIAGQLSRPSMSTGVSRL
jgi:hypothetical protein